MANIIVKNPNKDGYGTQKENIFIAQNQHGETLGVLLVYSYFDQDIEPEHPHNLQFYFHAIEGKELNEAIKDKLLENAFERAEKIKHEEKQNKTRVYACYLKDQQEKIDYFLQRGFAHDEGMLIIERHSSAPLPEVSVPAEIAMRSWKLDTDTDQHQFITTHRQIFPRHAYSSEKLSELKASPGWENFTAFHNAEIAGNIMVFISPENSKIGIIEDLFVLPEWRRRGIARYLLHTALAYFQKQGIERVQLELWSANKNAWRLYQKFGFTEVDETEIALGRYI